MRSTTKVQIATVLAGLAIVAAFATQARASETFYSAWGPVSQNVNFRAANLDSCTALAQHPCGKQARILNKVATTGLRRITASVGNPGGACTVNLKKRVIGALRWGAIPASNSAGDRILVEGYLGIWYSVKQKVDALVPICLGQGRRYRAKVEQQRGNGPGACLGMANAPTVVAIPTGRRRKLKSFAAGSATFECGGNVDSFRAEACLQLKFPRGFVEMDCDVKVRGNPRDHLNGGPVLFEHVYHLNVKWACGLVRLFGLREWRVVGNVTARNENGIAEDHFLAESSIRC